MTTIQAGFSTKVATDDVLREILPQLHKEPKLVLFFASTKQQFTELSERFHQQFPQAETVGVLTVGELTTKGFNEGSVSAMTFAGDDFRAKAVFMENIEQYPIFSRDQLIATVNELGISRQRSSTQQTELGLVFPNGLIAAEEKMLSIVNSIFDYPFPFFGGTAGDDAKFEQTLVACNGQVSSRAGVTVFLKTQLQTAVAKENIFTSTGKRMTITKVDLEQRIIYEINGRPAASEYARILGVQEAQLTNYFMTNPLGRVINDEIFIASSYQILNKGAIQMYCQVFEGMVVELLEPKDALATLTQTVEQFTGQFQRLEGVIGVNCILRKLQFQNQRIVPQLNQHLEKLPKLSGFCSYGEQLNNTQINQTLVLLGFGTLR